VVKALTEWDGECKIVYGRPRHPQSQGLVEQANGTVERMLTAAMEQHKTKEWADLLPLVMYNLNTSKSSSTKFMPYEIVFNKKPNTGSKKEIVDVDQAGVEKEVAIEEVVESEADEGMSNMDVEAGEVEEETNDAEITHADVAGFGGFAGVDEATEVDTISAKRARLNTNKLKNAEKMIKKHDHRRNKKSVDFEVGNSVTVKIPRIDRGGTEFPRLPGMVSKVCGANKEFYQIVTIYGILNEKSSW
jgi:ribosomal protein L21E